MQSEWRELIASLMANDVEFLVAGAHALAFYALPRYTEDLDLFVRRSAENGERLRRALHEFGIPVRQEAIEKLMKDENQMIVLGHEPFAVDLMNFLTGVEFSEAWDRKVEGEIGGVRAFILSREDYRATKVAAGRPKDLLDLALLDEVKGAD